MEKDELKYSHIRSFLNAEESRVEFERLRQTPLYRTGAKALHCDTTLYGGLTAHEPYEPMPPRLVELRRRVELHLGLFYGYFSVAAVRRLGPADSISWTAESADVFGHLSTFAFLSITAEPQENARTLELRSLSDSQPNTHSVRLASGDLFVLRRGAYRKYQYRMPLETSATGIHWQIVFAHLPPIDSRRKQRLAVDKLYHQYRYGSQLPQVKLEPHLKHSLSIVPEQAAQSLRQMTITEMSAARIKRNYEERDILYKSEILGEVMPTATTTTNDATANVSRMKRKRN